MDLTIQKRLAAQVLKCSSQKVVFDTSRLEEIKESITKVDIRSLVISHAIYKRDQNGPSRVRARKTSTQKAKGQRKGLGSRKGIATSREGRKLQWMNRIRKQKALLKGLRDKETIDTKQYRMLYNKAKGGFFRNLRHLKIYLNDLKEKK